MARRQVGAAESIASHGASKGYVDGRPVVLSTASGTTWATVTNAAVFTISGMSWQRIGPLVTAQITVTRAGANMIGSTTGDITNVQVASTTADFPLPIAPISALGTTTGSAFWGQLVLTAAGALFVTATLPNMSTGASQTLWGTGAAAGCAFLFLTNTTG